MMKKITVPLKDRAYDIRIGHGVLAQIGEQLRAQKIGKDALVVTHPSLQRLYGKELSASLLRAGLSVKFFTVAEGEASKSAACAMRLLEQIAAYDVKRQSFIIAFGGGVVGDLAGFVAAIYKRGIAYVHVPTSLLAQIDSSIGGKTGIDLTCGKNLVGVIYQPKLVFIDTALLKTLSRRQIQNGLAEAVKYGVIDDPALFTYIEKNHALFLKNNKEVMTRIVGRCAAIKARVVGLDERETKGIRTILNFGHTVGHAIEAAGRYGQYQHGEAVALGMRVALQISLKLRFVPSTVPERVERLLTNIGLPSKINSVKLKDIVDIMMHDKKFVGAKKRFVLTRKIGVVSVIDDVPLDVVIEAIEHYMC